MAKNVTTATVLAFEKKLVPSDGFMYGTTWQQRNNPETCQPLQLREKSVRGTISNRSKTGALKQADIEKPNLQRVDSCALGADQDTLKLSFTLKVLSGVHNPSACNSQEFKKTYSEAVEKYITEHQFTELARRYAINLANARFLWRNRVGAEHIEVQIKKLNQNAEKTWTFNATQMHLRDFNTTNPDITELAGEIANALSNKQDFLLLEINTYAQVGLAQDVYPSEELVLDKSTAKDKKSKILYHINNIAGMHSQKIGNALRTIDTWYPDYDTADIGAIAIEPYGAVTNLGTAYRQPKKGDFFNLFDKWATGGTLESPEDQHYVMAVLVRGGVFGESGKD